MALADSSSMPGTEAAVAAAAAAAVVDRRPSPGLTLNLSSNNPFRNHAASPAASPALPSSRSAPGERPVSRNPFLASFEDDYVASTQAQDHPRIAGDMASVGRASPQKATFGRDAQELFDNLTLNEQPPPYEQLQPKPAPPSETLPAQGHRTTRSQEEEQRQRNGMRGPPRPRAPPGELNVFSSPERSENRRPRRNSESSVADKPSLNAEEERRRKERRQKEREVRYRDGKPRDGRSTKPRKPTGLDIIDKLDVTGIYGPGLFHHDGPFDACNPHRNRKKDARAPMQAFPINSANMAIGGSGPVHKGIDMDRFHGREEEGFNDFNTTTASSQYYQGKKRPSIDRGTSNLVNPADRVEPIHGEETVGLGTSTFLEGAPASRNAIQRRESENETAAFQGAGITRKKSLAQRLRGMSQPRRAPFGSDGAPRSDYRREHGATSPESPNPSYAQYATSAKGVPQSAGGRLGMYETNPFFQDYDDAYEKKGASIRIAEAEKSTGAGPSTSRAREPGSPMSRALALERRVTADSGGEQETGGKIGGGFLSRVRSLKGGRRARPERVS